MLLLGHDAPDWSVAIRPRDGLMAVHRGSVSVCIVHCPGGPEPDTRAGFFSPRDRDDFHGGRRGLPSCPR